MGIDKSAVISIAKQEIGYLEKNDGNLRYLYSKKENAGYKNYTKYGYEMHKLEPQVMDYPAFWCDAFVDWCFYKAYGYQKAKVLLGGFDDYTRGSVQKYKDMGCYHAGVKGISAGDQIFFVNNSNTVCHTGLVIAVGEKTITTIEGNTSSEPGVMPNGGAVRKKSYAVTYEKIHGYGRPRYAYWDSDAATLIRAGQEHSINFTGHKIKVDGDRGPETRKQAVRVLQTALNLDYNKHLIVDGEYGPLTASALGSHYVERGETQYMVTAAEILLLLLGTNPNGVECPGTFGPGLEAAARASIITAKMFKGYLS